MNRIKTLATTTARSTPTGIPSCASVSAVHVEQSPPTEEAAGALPSIRRLDLLIVRQAKHSMEVPRWRRDVVWRQPLTLSAPPPLAPASERAYIPTRPSRVSMLARVRSAAHGPRRAHAPSQRVVPDDASLFCVDLPRPSHIVESEP